MIPNSRKFGRRSVLQGLFASTATILSAPLAEALSPDGTKLRGSIDVRQSGIIPDARNDKSRLLQAVLDHASATGKPVLLPAGVYEVSNIRLPRNATIIGVPGATRLVYAGGGHFLLGESCDELHLSGLVMDGANREIGEYAGAALRLSGVRRVTVDNCQVVGSMAAGIRVDRSSGRIERTHISGAAGEFALHAVENDGLAIVGNTIRDCAGGGIAIQRWQAGEDATLVTDNRIERIGIGGSAGVGIDVFRANSVLVSENRLKDCSQSGIRAAETENIQIVSNQCRHSGGAAIRVDSGYAGAVLASNYVDEASCGISIARAIDGPRMAVCSGNLVRNIWPGGSEGDMLAGVGIAAEADTTLSGNVVENCAMFGLMLGGAGALRDIVASSNIIRNANTGIYVSVLTGASNAVISDNVISGIRQGAIVGYEGRRPVTRDMGSGNNFGYDHLALERNRVS